MPGEAAFLRDLALAEEKMRKRLEKGWGAACEKAGQYAHDHHNYVNRSEATESSTKGGLLPEQSDPNKITGIVTAGTPWAVYLETTRKQGGTPVGEGRYIRDAFAFITPAITATQSEFLKVVAENMKD